MFHIQSTLPDRSIKSQKGTPDKLSLVSRSQPDLFSSVEEDDNAEVAAATAGAAAAADDAKARRAAEKLAANQIKVRLRSVSTIGNIFVLHGFLFSTQVRSKGAGPPLPKSGHSTKAQ